MARLVTWYVVGMSGSGDVAGLAFDSSAGAGASPADEVLYGSGATSPIGDSAGRMDESTGAIAGLFTNDAMYLCTNSLNMSVDGSVAVLLAGEAAGGMAEASSGVGAFAGEATSKPAPLPVLGEGLALMSDVGPAAGLDEGPAAGLLVGPAVWVDEGLAAGLGEGLAGPLLVGPDAELGDELAAGLDEGPAAGLLIGPAIGLIVGPAALPEGPAAWLVAGLAAGLGEGLAAVVSTSAAALGPEAGAEAGARVGAAVGPDALGRAG